MSREENPEQQQIAPQVVTCQAPHSMPFPPKLDLKGNLATNWRKFKRVWHNYEIASGLQGKEDGVRVATFLTCVGPDAMELFDGFELTEDNSKKLDKVIEAFDTFCVGKTNETYERYCFNKREQGPNETIDTYVAALRNLARTCNYNTLEDSLLRDRIVMGVHDNGTRKKLLQEPKLTLDRCIDICRANEKTSSQLRNILNEEVQAVYKNTKKPGGNGYTHKQKDSDINCSKCGQRHPVKKCPAWGKECLKCGNFNHFAAKCQKSQQAQSLPQKHRKSKSTRKGKRAVHVVNDTESSEDEFMFSVEQINSIGSKRINAIMTIGAKHVEFMLDSGSSVNILPARVYRKLQNDRHCVKLRKTHQRLVMYNKSETTPIGKATFNMQNPVNGEKYELDFVVVQGDVHPILGSDAIQRMQMIKVQHHNIQDRCAEIETVNTVTDTIAEIEKTGVFDGDGKLDGTLKLELDESVKPVKIPVRKIPLAVRSKVKTELERLRKKGIIEPVTIPTDWISSMVVVTKSTGKVRLCIDPKPLNVALKRNHYVMPTLDDLLPELGNAKVFSVADAKNGFWHVQMDEASSFLTTFATPWGRYRWKRMPFGISPAPEEFQKAFVFHSNSQQKEPIINHEICKRPWQKVGADIFTLNQKDFLVTVDYYSSYFEVDRLHDKTAKEIISKLRVHFARHGLPDSVMTDNGPPFGSYDFSEFAQNYGFEHVTSSPHYPQSNGKVENAVKTAKRIMEKSIEDERDPYLALLNLRNTPIEGLDCSPAQLLFNRRTKTQLPMSASLLEPMVPHNINEKQTHRKAKQSFYYDRNTKELASLKAGDSVRIRPQGRSKVWTKAKVLDQVDIRSYRVRTEDGREYRRNRRHLRKTNEPLRQEHQLIEPLAQTHKTTSSERSTPISRIPIPVQHESSSSAAVPLTPKGNPSVSPKSIEKPTKELRTTGTPHETTTRLGRVIKPPKRLDL